MIIPWVRLIDITEIFVALSETPKMKNQIKREFINLNKVVLFNFIGFYFNIGIQKYKYIIRKQEKTKYKRQYEKEEPL